MNLLNGGAMGHSKYCQNSIFNMTSCIENKKTRGLNLQCLSSYLVNLTTYFSLNSKLKPMNLTLFKISCDFDKAAIKAFRFLFPRVKIIGFYIYFSSAIFKKVN